MSRMKKRMKQQAASIVDSSPAEPTATAKHFTSSIDLAACDYGLPKGSFR